MFFFWKRNNIKRIIKFILLLSLLCVATSGFAQDLRSEDIVVVPKLILDQYGFSGDIAVSPKDGSVHVIWVYDWKIYYRIRTASGSWQRKQIIPNNDIQVYAGEGKGTPLNARKCVGITIDSQGIVHIVFSSRYGPVNYMYGNSGNWSTPIVVGPKGHISCLPDIVELNGDIFVCFHDSDDPEEPKVYTVAKINGKWNRLHFEMIGDYPSLAVGENGMVYLVHREFQYQHNHNACFAYRIPGLTDWIYKYYITNAARRLGHGPGMVVGNSYIYVGWSNSTGVPGDHKSEMFCARAEEPGLAWMPQFGKVHGKLFYENTGDPHPRMSVYSDSTVLYLNSRRLRPGYLIWNGKRWGNHLKGPWEAGVTQVASDGKTVWIVASSSVYTNREVSVSGLTNPYAEKYDFENNKPVFSSEPPTGAVKNQLWEYQPFGSDPDGDEVTYALTFNPDDMAINSQTGLIQWTPNETEDAEVIVGVKIVDEKGAFSTQYFKLAVVDGPPAAEFAADVILGEVPLTVQFSDHSVGVVDSWLWDFGNAETSIEKNPQTTYTVSGQFTVKLTITGPGGSDEEIKKNYITIGDPPPQAGFTSDVQEGPVPLAVQFSDSSIGGVTSWRWDFGDGLSSSEQNPQHTYQNSGVFTVGLRVGGPSGSDSTSSVDYITALEPPPIAGFTVNSQSGERPFTAQFTDTSTGLITSWGWNFGDGESSSEQNPSHTYADSGSYGIHLEVIGPGGTSAIEKPDYIQVLATPFSADFTADPLNGESPLTVQFQDLSAGKVTGWQWYFGDTYSVDGGISAEQNPGYTYTNAGTYVVILTVQGFDTATTVLKHNFITITEGTVVQDKVELPNQFFLNQNFPNPFNAETMIEYGLSEDADVYLKIYDMRGKLVKKLDAGRKSAGNYHIVWDGCNEQERPVPSGLYLLKLRAGPYQVEKKMLMLK